jgi:2-oxoisovalerate dehydrogenase E2 component (dihydrolipoyl transacylase)
MPDLGEGTVEAEIVGWRVKPGDVVAEDDVIVEVMTEKAAVEVPAPVAGRVLSTTGTPGDMVPVGAELIVFETDVAASADTAGAAATPATAAAQPAVSSAAATSAKAPTVPPPAPTASSQARAAAPGIAASTASASPTASPGAASAAGAAPRTGVTPGAATASGPATASAAGAAPVSGPAAASAAGNISPAGARSGRPNGNGTGNGHAPAERQGRVVTSPAIRRRAREAGVDLTQLAGSGPNGRILRHDFEAYVSSRSGPKLVHSRGPEAAAGGEHLGRAPGGVGQVDTGPPTEEIKVIGLRRLIAQRMSEAKRNIPHFAYVEELDVTELESLRSHLNGKRESGTPSLTYLPFLVIALIRVLRDFPQCNAHYDAERGVIIRHRAVHVGVATQTPDGLKVPVVKNAQALSLWALAAEIRRVTEAARTNKATREELSGSTITVTSLGKLGGIASTPIINAPEVSIIGINRAVERPMVYGGAITIRRMMNLSSSFDHRFVDGHDAAALIQALKERIEHPATIFID